ncbi:hypothetical protein EYF80_016554 [Liparis tanakae]|uniref:Uncharacterized protein n=1 Tax=Liparis tanakae TaxID=230148 RepID=A0A4Z2I7W9_9TELE|nr:hypothetical protein EYF80_016554 [Liparis tanakae]
MAEVEMKGVGGAVLDSGVGAGARTKVGEGSLAGVDRLQYSHEGCLALLHVVSFGPCAGFAAEAHDEATLVGKVTGDVHSEQQEEKRYDEDPSPEHDAHGELFLIPHIWQTRDHRGS